jgi:hypothetical protein
MILRRFKLTLAALLFTAGGLFGVVAPAYAAAAPYHGTPIVASFKSDACGGVTAVAGGNCSSGAGSLNTAIKAAINILSAIVGIAAVIVIIISGLRFITANGDASSVATARNGIIYAVAGLIIVALSQAIVHFVLGKV